MECSKKNVQYVTGHPLWLSGKESACSAGDLRSIPELGRSPGEGNGNPLQSLVGYGPWGCKESDMTEPLSTHTHTHTQIDAWINGAEKKMQI